MAQLSVMYRGLLGFGGYPAPMHDERKKKTEQSKVLDSLAHFKVFVDLTENTVGYIKPEGSQYISFPMPDSGVPEKKEPFKALLLKIQEILEKGISVYVHCEHGRGRTGVVMVCMISILYGIPYEEALEQVNNKFHETCPPGSSWNEKTIPCHSNQRDFCRRFLQYNVISTKPAKVADEQALYCWKPQDIQNAVDEIGSNPILLEVIAHGEELFGFCVYTAKKLYILHLHAIHKDRLISGAVVGLLGSDVPKIGYLNNYFQLAKQYGYKINNYIDVVTLSIFSNLVEVPPQMEHSKVAWATTPISAAAIEAALNSAIQLEEIVKTLITQSTKSPELTPEDLDKIKMLEIGKAKAILFNSKTFASVPVPEREKYISGELEKAAAAGRIRVDNGIVVLRQQA